jgi:cyclic pyranopterin phosphate synthase
MVDVAAKDVTHRSATARGRIRMSREAFELVSEGRLPKGDVDAVARIAGIQAAKRTADLIPLCHPLPIDHISLDVAPEPGGPALTVTATVRSTGRTGVEMEALTAVSVALLAIYDMVKGVDRAMVIEEILLMEKRGGASGVYRRDEGGAAG